MFTIKIWEKFTHKQKLFNIDNINSVDAIDEQLSEFFGSFYVMKSKIGGFLLQFPPRYGFSEKHQTYLQFLIKRLPSWGKYFIEFRHESWFESPMVQEIKSNQRLSLVTAFIPHTSPYFAQDQSSQYIRMIGDRALTKFNRTQRPQSQAMDDLKTYLNKIRVSHSIEDIFVIFNNHFRGFAPHDVISLAKDLDLPYKEYKKNKSLLDFM